MILHLIRHPRPLIEPGICYGQLDMPAENPALVADKLRPGLPAGVPVWSSPLQRCRALAELLHPAPRYDERLMEMNFGLWEGRPWNDIPRQALEEWANDLEHFAPPGGESAFQVRQRILQFFEKNPAPEMLLVSHAGVIRILLSIHYKQSLADVLRSPVAYGEVFALYSFCHI